MFWIQKESSKNLEVDGIEVLNQDGIVKKFGGLVQDVWCLIKVIPY